MPDDQRDFFISFNSADEAYAKAISDALRAGGFTTFFHPDDLKPGGHIPKWMDDALRSSRQMLALCSPEYMAEGAVYSEAERYAWFWRDTRGEKFKLIPVVLKDVEFPPLLAVYKRLTATHTTPAQAAAAIVAALKKPAEIKERETLRGTQPNEPVRRPAYVHTTRLPETGYEHLVGRDTELERLDEAWLDARINVLSLIAEGGAGKSALVNEWLKRMQAHNYPGAETVLGWSFYSQGTTERATSAEEFLNWALEKLGITITATSVSAKADAIAEAMMSRRVLLVLDGVEPLQHGPGSQLGQLKDLGLRSLLRRFAAAPPGAAHGQVVLTSRLAVKDIARWQDRAAPTVDVGRLSDEAGAALLQDNGVDGTDKELKAAAQDFGGHPLALGLLASFLKETQAGDVRRRDHIRAYFADAENPRHDHAKRVMESYEKDWLASQPVLLSVMHMVGLFDRPASGDCLNALRAEIAIEGFTDQLVKLDDGEWLRGVMRLREVRLLAPPDPAAPDAIDAHPLVREWFGGRLRQTNETAWKAAHGRLYEHLRDTTDEGKTPTLGELAPLYQAISHGCRAERHQDALREIYQERLCRIREDGGFEYYTSFGLGALGSDLATISSFFEKPYEMVAATLPTVSRYWLLNEAAFALGAQGRFGEALAPLRAASRMTEMAEHWENAAICASNVSEYELLVGEIVAAVASAARSVEHADRSGMKFQMVTKRVRHANALLAFGQRKESELMFADAEKRQREWEPRTPLLYALQGYQYCELVLSKGNWVEARERGVRSVPAGNEYRTLHGRALNRLTLGRAHLGLACAGNSETTRDDARIAHAHLEEALDGLRAAGNNQYIPHGLLARATFRRCVGDWNGAARDLEEVEDIAEPGPLRLVLCDMALERARLALACAEGYAPLNEFIEASPSERRPSSEADCKGLRDEAAKQIAIATGCIESCGYHRRDEELAELQAVLRGERAFASLPPRA